MAEALIGIADPLDTILTAGAAPPDRVARSIARSLAPAEADVPVPAWLRPEQARPYRRVLAALDRYSGVLLADPVGSGKTYIALAVAARHRAVVALIPASLRAQWRALAAGLGVPIQLHSHEALSRGRRPALDARLVIIDESHRLRNPATIRYRTLAPWLFGRRVLLLSATPLVNRLDDLVHQLLLGIRDDALAVQGAPSLTLELTRREAHQAVGDLVLCRPRPPDHPKAVHRVIAPESSPADQSLLAAIDGLKLSRQKAVAALLRVVLWRALASSPRALAATLRRYLRLLQHASTASHAGRSVSRGAIRAFSDCSLDQLVLWEMMPDSLEPVDLVLADRENVSQLATLAAGARSDPRSDALRLIVADRLPTVVFTVSRDTLVYLREALADQRPAWITGSAAGIGAVRMPREAVLHWFKPSIPAGSRPDLLLATDVAAEGLDLQRAQRVVHFDHPWTSIRIDQREGRAIRLGSRAEMVDVISFVAPPAVEARLGQEVRLLAKRSLAAAAGLSDAGRWQFRWRAELAQAAEQGEAAPGFAVAVAAEEGWLIGLAVDLLLASGEVRRQPASLMWLTHGGTTEEPSLVAERLSRIGQAAMVRAPTDQDRSDLRQVLPPLVRARLIAAEQSQWTAREVSRDQRRLARRMRRLGAAAAWRRDRLTLELAERALDWLAGGLTAGESALLGELVDACDSTLLASWPRLLNRARVRGSPVPRLTGVIRVVKDA